MKKLFITLGLLLFSAQMAAMGPGGQQATPGEAPPAEDRRVPLRPGSSIAAQAGLTIPDAPAGVYHTQGGQTGQDILLPPPPQGAGAAADDFYHTIPEEEIAAGAEDGDYYIKNDTRFPLTIELLNPKTRATVNRIDTTAGKTFPVTAPPLEEAAEYILKVSGTINVTHPLQATSNLEINRINPSQKAIDLKINGESTRKFHVIKVEPQAAIRRISYSTKAEQQGMAQANYENADFLSYFVTNNTPYPLIAQITSSTIPSAERAIGPKQSIEFAISPEHQRDPELLIKISFTAENTIKSGSLNRITAIPNLQITPEGESAGAALCPAPEQAGAAAAAGDAGAGAGSSSWRERARKARATAASRTNAAAVAAAAKRGARRRFQSMRARATMRGSMREEDSGSHGD